MDKLKGGSALLIISVLLLVGSCGKKHETVYIITKEDSVEMFETSAMLADANGNIVWKNPKYFPDSIVEKTSQLNGNTIYKLRRKDSAYVKWEVIVPALDKGIYIMSFNNDTLRQNEPFYSEIAIRGKFAEGSQIILFAADTYKIDKVKTPDGVIYKYTRSNNSIGVNSFSGRIVVGGLDEEFTFRYYVHP